MTQTLFADKSSGTLADPLLAYGLAVVVGDVLKRTEGRGQPSVRLSDHGAYYRLDCTPALDDARLAAIQAPYVPAVVIRTRKNAAKLPADLPPQAVVDYEVERDKRAEFFEIRKGLPKEALVAQARGEDHPALAALRGQEPHEHWDVFRAINPSALIGYNKLMTQWWAVQAALPEVLLLLRDLFAHTPNDLAAASAAWKELDEAHGWGIKAETTAAQIYNPSQGKGQNRAKADSLRMGNVKGFWLVEWLKAVGFYHAALTKQLRGVKDRKTYVLAAGEIDLGESDKIMHAFQGRMARSETAIRSDVLAAIRYTQAMLDFTSQREGASLKARLFKHRRPSRVVSGFYSAFYKNLGQSVATMNLSFIGLPGWIRVEGESDVGDALDVLAEHEAIVRQFDESHGDAYNLLLLYRDFLSGNDLRPFFEFTTAYSGYFISQKERRGGYVPQFTTTNLGRLIMNSQEGPRLSKILETPGFQNIAYAIRQATVTAQYRKNQLNDRRYDVRYGLGQQLARKAAYPNEFIAELAGFLTKYNAENAQVMEKRAGPYRRSIRTSDIDDIVALIDEFDDSRLICNLLVAYGYARVPREESSDGSNE